MGTGDDSVNLMAWEVGNLAAVEWTRHLRLNYCGMETTLETKGLGSGEENRDLAAGE